MRRIMMTIGSTVLVLGSSMIAVGQDKAPAQQAPAQAPKQAPMQAPMQAPKQAPMQAPTQKVTPMQAPVQAPHQKHTQAPTQSPVQKGADYNKPMASDQFVPNDQVVMSRPGLFRRFR
jgi:hypothetical protein